MKYFKTSFLILLVAFSCSKSPQESTSNQTSADQKAPDAPPADAPPMGDPSNNPDMTDFAAEVDTNGDGKMSKEEWTSKGLPMTSFNGFENGRGYVTLEDYQVNAAPPGIDLDGDGRLTIEEFVAFDKKMQENPPPPPNN